MNTNITPVSWDSVVIADWDSLMKPGIPDSLVPMISA